jgi:anthranilate synthase / indole-3-glycerol phosphate synthase / phosphoribosylanthranilate isomerase
MGQIQYCSSLRCCASHVCACCTRLGTEPLVEVNNAAEMRQALYLGSHVIGVNNHNLHNFDADVGTTARLADMVKGSGAILCALSGIWGAQDVRGYVEQEIGVVLVGESLMRAKDTRAFIRELLDLAADAHDSSSVQQPGNAFRKVDGITSATIYAVEDADLLGIYLSSSHPKSLSLKEAGEIERRAGLQASALTVSHSVITPK